MEFHISWPVAEKLEELYYQHSEVFCWCSHGHVNTLLSNSVLLLCMEWYSPNSTWLVTSRHDTFYMSSPWILAV